MKRKDKDYDLLLCPICNTIYQVTPKKDYYYLDYYSNLCRLHLPKKKCPQCNPPLWAKKLGYRRAIVNGERINDKI